MPLPSELGCWLAWFCVGNHNCREFISIGALPCPEHIALPQYSLPLDLIIHSLLLLQCSLSLGSKKEGLCGKLTLNTNTTSYVRKLWRKVHADCNNARKLYSNVKGSECIEPGEREWSRGRLQMLGNIQNTGRNLWDFHSKRQLSGEREKGIFNNYPSEASCFSPLSYRGLKILSHHLEQICKNLQKMLVINCAQTAML